jgi:hypothetical protein
MCYAKLTGYLIEGAYGRVELAELTGLHRETVGFYCTALKKEGHIHICDWEQDRTGRWSIAILKFGNKPDAPKPATKCRNLIKREYMARKRMINDPRYMLAA